MSAGRLGDILGRRRVFQAPPRPCRTRPATNTFSESDTPATADPLANAAMPIATNAQVRTVPIAHRPTSSHIESARRTERH